MEIDLYSDVPAYEQIADMIRRGITDGTYGPRQPIPSISAIQQDTGLAPNTIRKGIGLLKAEGLVRTVQGRGTFVVERDEKLIESMVSIEQRFWDKVLTDTPPEEVSPDDARLLTEAFQGMHDGRHVMLSREQADAADAWLDLGPKIKALDDERDAAINR